MISEERINTFLSQMIYHKDIEPTLRQAIKEAEAELDKHRWRKVEDELPEESGSYIAYNGNTTFWVFFHGRKGWIFEGKPVPDGAEVTHWKPIIPPEDG